jgi:hypothetical protein
VSPLGNQVRIPPPYPPQVRAEARRCFFGVSEIIQCAVLTPISALYNYIGEQIPPVTSATWWPSRHGAGILHSLVPQSTAVLDAICALEPSTEVVFLGLAGALGVHSVGDIVEVETALLDGLRAPRTSTRPYEFTPTTLKCVGSLAETISHWQLLATQAECVDMETGYVYAACEAQKKTATSILVIADRMPDSPFYAAHPPANLEAISRRIAAVLP